MTPFQNIGTIGPKRITYWVPQGILITALVNFITPSSLANDLAVCEHFAIYCFRSPADMLRIAKWKRVERQYLIGDESEYPHPYPYGTFPWLWIFGENWTPSAQVS